MRKLYIIIVNIIIYYPSSNPFLLDTPPIFCLLSIDCSFIFKLINNNHGIIKASICVHHIFLAAVANTSHLLMHQEVSNPWQSRFPGSLSTYLGFGLSGSLSTYLDFGLPDCLSIYIVCGFLGSLSTNLGSGPFSSLSTNLRFRLPGSLSILPWLRPPWQPEYLH